MRTAAPWLFPLAVSCVSEYQLDELPFEGSPPDVVHTDPPEPSESCPTFFGAPPGVRSTTAITAPIGHCAEGVLQLGLEAVDVDPTQVEALVYLVDLSDPDDLGEHWVLLPSSFSTPPRTPEGECGDATYWSRVVPPETTPETWTHLGWSRYPCDALTDGSPMAYAYALLHEDGRVLDCVVAGADPDALRLDPRRGPHFPLDACREVDFAYDWAREPHDP